MICVGGLLAGCGDDPEESAEPDTPVDEVTVGQLLADPGAYDGAEVIVREATVVPIEPSGGFILEGDEGRILVSAPAGTPQLEPGETVPVQAEVVRFTEPAAETLGEEFADAPELADTPTEVGDPYLLLRSLPAAGADTEAPVDTAEYEDDQAEFAAVAGDSGGRYGEDG